jgi:glycosyltransferase involved in cell wall biosynthesis
MDKSNKHITIITAVYNISQLAEGLCVNINSIDNDNFDWIVVDGQSTDNTLEILNKYSNRMTKVISESDFGIYDALNKGIKACETPYYLVIGADDRLDKAVISNFYNIINKTSEEFDIITSKIEVDNTIVDVNSGGTWLHKQSSYVSSHAVGTIFKKQLHSKFGYYSKSYPIAADQLFILTVCKSDAKVFKAEHISGVFSKDGVSSQDVLGTLTESFRIQMKFENKFVQIIIFFLKVLKNYKRL